MAKIKNIKKEAHSINKKKKILDLNLLDALIGEKEPSIEEKLKLQKLQKSLGKRIYKEIIYLLTNIKIENFDEAKKTYEDIIKHKNKMTNLLKRNVSIQVAALDYLQNVKNIIKKPTIIESEKFLGLIETAIQDPTTKGYDKDIFEIDLNEAIKKHKNNKNLFSLLFIDIDNLKKINDSFGHYIGTKTIKYISNSIRKNLRSDDSFYRYGGDEFVLLLPNSNNEEASKVAIRLKNNLKGNESDLPFSPSVSIGIATYGDNGIKDIINLINAADKALYNAKLKGKNTISSYSHKLKPTNRIKLDKSIIIQGKALVKGYARGNIFHYKDIMTREFETRDVFNCNVEEEFQRIKEAIKKVQNDLIKIKENVCKELDEHSAMIFDVHYSILEDESFIAKIEKELKKRMVNAENVIRNVFRSLKRDFKNSGSNVLEDRSLDLEDIERRLLKVLIGIEGNLLANVPRDSILVTKRLLPSDTIHFKNLNTKAIITEEGGVNSHAAIIARMMNIPLISKINYNIRSIPEGTLALVDGFEGVVIINPSMKESSKVMNQIKQRDNNHQKLISKTKHKKININDTHIKILASISCHKDIKTALDYGCDGIGLYRLENFYMKQSSLPSEEKILKELEKDIRNLTNKDIILRLTDFGGDKIIPYLNIERDSNASLGLRGVRLLIKHENLLRTQLRICLKLSSHSNVKILVPMITISEDIEHVKFILEEEKQFLRKNKIAFNENINLGAMIETPSAIADLKNIIKFVDFVNIGTNDLIQYFMAADREKLSVSKYYDKGTNLILKDIKHIINICKLSNIDCILCGEMAHNLKLTKKFIELGLENFCVHSPKIPYVKENILKMDK